ncbi:MAG: ribonuclease P protein component [Alphaproteobacteria bacterium]|nr:ribonuclease P protein component [Alphaproteobacteria bacterium]
MRAANDVSFVCSNVIVQAARPVFGEEERSPRVGFTATKRLGKAHIRNRTKRRLRAVVREYYEKYMLANVDYVLIGRYATHCCPYKDLKADVKYALKKINKIITKGTDDEKDPASAD